MAKTRTSFKKGNPGRRPGTPNKITKNMREFIEEFLHDNKEQLKTDWKKLTPKDRIMMFKEFLSYIMPSLKATSVDIKLENLKDEDLDRLLKKLENT